MSGIVWVVEKKVGGVWEFFDWAHSRSGGRALQAICRLDWPRSEFRIRKYVRVE